MMKVTVNVNHVEDENNERTIDADFFIGIAKGGEDGATMFIGKTSLVERIMVIERLLRDLNKYFGLELAAALAVIFSGITKNDGGNGDALVD